MVGKTTWQAASVIGLLAGIALLAWSLVPTADMSDAAPLPSDPSMAALRESAAAHPTAADEPPQWEMVIPSLGIRAHLVPVTIQNSVFPVPSDPRDVGISTTGAALCANTGITLMAGHVSNQGARGALWPLAATVRGTRLAVRCPNGNVGHYRAIGTPQVVAKADLPNLQRRSGPPTLIVVTCGGPVRADGHHADNVVATFVPERP